MTPEPPPLDRLLHLVARAERGALLPAEAAQLRTGIRALYALDDPPAHNTGPTVAECAEADRRWWGGEKTGEQ